MGLFRIVLSTFGSNVDRKAVVVQIIILFIAQHLHYLQDVCMCVLTECHRYRTLNIVVFFGIEAGSKA